MREETIKQYTSIDGHKFLDRNACQRYENELEQIQPILNELNRCDNIKANEYIQHDINDLLLIKRKIFTLVQHLYKDSFPHWLEWNGDDVHPMSIVGRVLDDNGGPIAKAWRQLSNYNFDLGREYQQPYFALHPEEATKCIK